jgi:hypothetical protein
MNRDSAIPAFEMTAAFASLLRGTIDNTTVTTTEVDGYCWRAIHRNRFLLIQIPTSGRKIGLNSFPKRRDGIGIFIDPEQRVARIQGNEPLFGSMRNVAGGQIEEKPPVIAAEERLSRAALLKRIAVDERNRSGCNKLQIPGSD